MAGNAVVASSRAVAGPEVEQLLFTRFSLRLANALGPQPRSWIDERLALFERFTLPTVRGQVMADFTWWLLCDVQTDPDVADHLRSLDPRIRLALIGPRREHESVRARADLVDRGWEVDRVVRPDSRIVIQTRLDSDDGLHPAYLQDVTDEIPLFLGSGSRHWLRVAACGYQYDTKSRRVYGQVFPRGPFQSYYQQIPPGDRAVSMVPHHGEATLSTDGIASYARFSWLQVVHGGNVRNQIYSRHQRHDVDEIGRQFGIQL